MYALFQFQSSESPKPYFEVFAADEHINLSECARMRLVGLYTTRQEANNSKIGMEIEAMFEAKEPKDAEAKRGLCSVVIYPRGTEGHRDQGRLLTFKDYDWLRVEHDAYLKIESIHIPDMLTDRHRFFDSLVPKPPDDGRCGREEIDRDAAGNFI